MARNSYRERIACRTEFESGPEEGAQSSRFLARLVMLAARVELARAACARRERLRPTIHGSLDRRASALVGERLVVKAWDDVQVRVVEGSARLAEAVPDEHVAVWCEPLVQGRLRLEQ
jgi:hypothetical protein